ncbi:MAG: recombinase family protein [Bdellovibrionales bacterium]|nr:recombinase family protein [Bdellovibrionales bacterium]
MNNPTPHPTVTTAAIYVRVSTENQHDDLQFTELRAYAARMG